MSIQTMLPGLRMPTTPGEMLVEEFLKPLKMTQAAFAEKTGLGPRAVNEICRGKRAVTVRTAILMSDVLGNSAEFWLNCQRTLDIWQTLKDMGRLEETVRLQPSVVAKKRASVEKVKKSPKKASKTPGARKATRKKSEKEIPAKIKKRYA
jgi:addiction module HigA family antidote